ncbi:MAG: FHA domain-containing protein [Desulfobacterales bacterium]|nr:FHA domain-containing protein [Desulfobacterales bacterium]
MKKLLTTLIITILFFSASYGTIFGQTINNSGNSTEPVNQDIVIVLDNSGSMKINDPSFLTIEVVKDFIKRLDNKATLGMVIFDKKADLIEPLTGITGVPTKKRLLKSLEKVNYKGLYSNSPAGIERAVYELKTNGRKNASKTIIFLTDGIVDTGDKSQDILMKKWLTEDLAMACKKAEIRIFSIAFTNDADFSVIQSLALKTDGEYFRAYEIKGIKPIFSRIKGIIGQKEKEEISLKTTSGKNTSVKKISPELIVTEQKIQKPETIQPENIKQEIPRKQKTSGVINGIYIKSILTGIAILLCLIVILTFFRKKAETKDPDNEVPDGISIPQAILIDVKNITLRKTTILTKNVMNIGRGLTNDIIIPDNTISGFHATIKYKDQVFFLEDQKSRNKTFLNDVEIEPHTPKKLKSGDEIIFGVFKFIFMRAFQTPTGETTAIDT